MVIVNNAMTRLRLFLSWYKQLTAKQWFGGPYGKLKCIEYAWYNSKHYTLDGNYRK